MNTGIEIDLLFEITLWVLGIGLILSYISSFYQSIVKELKNEYSEVDVFFSLNSVFLIIFLDFNFFNFQMLTGVIDLLSATMDFSLTLVLGILILDSTIIDLSFLGYLSTMGFMFFYSLIFLLSFFCQFGILQLIKKSFYSKPLINVDKKRL